MSDLLGVYRPHRRRQIMFPEQGRTHQSFKDQCDVNRIMAKFEETGTIDHANTYRGLYGDFSALADYHTLCNQVIRAQSMFMELPSKIRAMFRNDPGEFLAFAEDPENAEQMVELGLMRPEDVPEAPPEPEKKVAHKSAPLKDVSQDEKSEPTGDGEQ